MKSALLSFLFLSYLAAATGKAPEPGLPAGSDPYFSFIENKGQWTGEIRYKAELPGGAVFITDEGLVYHFVSRADAANTHGHTVTEDLAGKGPGHNVKETAHNAEDGKQKPVRHHAYKVSFAGANPHPAFQPAEKRSYYHNYFPGSDPGKWAGRVELFGNILLEHIYDGIDMQLYGKEENILKYDFIVSPGADPGMIRLVFNGVRPRLTAEGTLLLRTSVNEVIENAPYCYQVIGGRKVTVRSRFRVEGHTLSFDFPEGYRKEYPLVIDPELVFSTYSGATGAHHYGQSATYDIRGNMYAGALSTSTGWPVTLGAFQTTASGSSVAINKYNPDGTSLLYATYYGGNVTDVPNTMRVNSKNELVVAGATNSSNLPVKPGAYSRTFRGHSDIFVAHFSEDGDRLVGATYVGGTGEEPRSLDVAIPGPAAQNGAQSVSPVEIAFDGEDNIWVVSNTYSSDFPVTPGAQQTANAGGFDAVIFQLDTACSQLMYSSFLGGTNDDAAFGIELNGSGNIVICGGTRSTDFPVTPRAFHTTAPGGTWDGFAAVIDATTKTLLHATFLGTAATDNAVKLQIDCDDNIYVLGRNVPGSAPDSYPVSAGVWSWPLGDVFIDKLTPDLSASLLSTVLGKERAIPYDGFYPTAFMVDGCGTTYLAGMTVSPRPKLPVTADARDQEEKKFWFCVLDPGFSNLRYASYFGQRGDNHIHSGTSRFDPRGFLYQSLCITDNGFPTTPGSWSPSKRNNSTRNDIVSFKIAFDLPLADIQPVGSQGAGDTTPHCVRGCKPGYFQFTRPLAGPLPFTVHFSIGGSAVNGTDYRYIPDSIVIPANSTTASLEIAPLLAAGPTGVKDVTITMLNTCTCSDLTRASLLIYDSLYLKILTPADTVCPGTAITIEADMDPGLHFEWWPAALIPGPAPHGRIIHPVPEITTTYTVTAVQPGAPATCPPSQRSYQVVVEPYPALDLPFRDTGLCFRDGDSILLSVKAYPENIDWRFSWTPATGLANRDGAYNKFHAPPGDYVITAAATGPVAGCTQKDSLAVHVLSPYHFAAVRPSDTTIQYGDEIRLEASGNAVSWTWSPDTYLSSPFIQSPDVRPLESMVYHLVAIAPDGCSDTVEANIRVKYVSHAYLPNAFSPDGNGLNDLLRIRGIVFEKLNYFKIFNRFGQQVFATTDPDAGWDGTFNGASCETGTYYYFLQLTYPTGRSETQKGDITLVR